MSWRYSCPKCRSVINPDETVILVAARAGSQMLVGFHPQPGNYTFYAPPGMELVHGSRYEFYCPLCRQNLASRQHENLSEIDLRQGDVVRKVLFSNIAGERATYVVSEENLEGHGEHSDYYDRNLKKS